MPSPVSPDATTPDDAPASDVAASAPAVPPRAVAVPVVLLLAGTLAIVGLAAPATPEALRVTAASTSTSVLVGPLTATAPKRLDLLDGPLAVPAPVVEEKAAAPARASRSRKAPAKKKPVGYFRPNGGGISSPYGMRWGRLHKGVDFNGSYGSPIRAVTSGRVVSAGYDGGYGNLVVLRHGDGTTTAYAHMSKILVRGGSVDAGETIGLVGSTGNSTGPHLHFEVRVGGSPVNPLPWLRKHGVRV